MALDPTGRRADQILTSPLFELETTRDLETQRLITKYTELTSLSQLGEEQSA